MSDQSRSQSSSVFGAFVAAVAVFVMMLRMAPSPSGLMAWAEAGPSQWFSSQTGPSPTDLARADVCGLSQKFAFPQTRDEGAQLYRAILFGDSERLPNGQACR